MDFIQIKIEPDNHILFYITAIQKFDCSLSIGEIKHKIETDAFAVEFDLEYYDVVEDFNGIDRKQLFRQLISQLLDSGALIELYHNGEATTLTLFDNWLSALQETAQQIQRDIDRESEEKESVF